MKLTRPLLTTIRVVLAYGVNKSYIFHQMDIKTAFLYGELKENIYIDIPDGMKVENGSFEVK